jgi:hypothetical protein
LTILLSPERSHDDRRWQDESDHQRNARFPSVLQVFRRELEMPAVSAMQERSGPLTYLSWASDALLTRPLRVRAAVIPPPRESTAGDGRTAVARISRLAQVMLGLLWVIDGVLQFQPYMFGKTFITGVLLPNAAGQPGIIGAPITWIAHLIEPHVALSATNSRLAGRSARCSWPSCAAAGEPCGADRRSCGSRPPLQDVQVVVVLDVSRRVLDQGPLRACVITEPLGSEERLPPIACR